MAKHKCFLSFHYKPDAWRVQQIKNMGVIEEQPLLTSNKWEEIKKKGEAAVENWINDNMKGKDCLVVLIGSKTAGRKWVNHEIRKAWRDGLGVLAIYVHNLKDAGGNQTEKGSDPLAGLLIDGQKVDGKLYDPPYSISTNVYTYIAENIDTWVKAAVAARKRLSAGGCLAGAS
jgi:hypothetical protein